MNLRSALSFIIELGILLELEILETLDFDFFERCKLVLEVRGREFFVFNRSVHCLFLTL